MRCLIEHNKHIFHNVVASLSEFCVLIITLVLEMEFYF